jgi:alkanesulfonate monooxygenase SsuD/methylene tetrahydromethanopterin reductase-like flavin-dependent oxidoreductase (luciferase family)
MPRELSVAFQTDKPLAAYGPLAAAAEGYGFDGVTVYNDLLYQPAWLPLHEIARHTRRVRIGPAAVNPFTCHPVSIAGNVALLDEASDGRAYLGLARGAWLDFLGLAPARPVTALREAFECVRHPCGAPPSRTRASSSRWRAATRSAGAYAAPTCRSSSGAGAPGRSGRASARSPR